MENASWTERNLNNLPKEITSQNKFCFWKSEPSKDGKGKPQKVPYTISRWGGLERKFPYGSFCSFHKLSSMMRRHSRKGFMPGFYLRDSGLSVIDIDDYFSSPTLDSIIADLDNKGCYIEVSPSGKGLHIFYSGFLDWTNGRNRSYTSLKVEEDQSTTCEVYSSKDIRFITLTGQVIEFSNSSISQPLAKAEEIEEELMKLKELFFVYPRLELEIDKASEANLLNSKSQDSIRNSETANSIKVLASIVENIKNSEHCSKLISFGKEAKPCKYKSSSEADMSFAGLIASFLPKELSVKEKINIVAQSFEYLRFKRVKTENRIDYILDTASKAVSNMDNYYPHKSHESQESLVSKKCSTIKISSILKICNIMQMFHLGKSYSNFEYVNNKNENNSLSVTSPESLTATDFKYFIQMLFQYKQSVKENNLSKDGYFKVNIKQIFESLNQSRSGAAYNSFYRTLLKLSKVYICCHKLIDVNRNLYSNYTGSLLSCEIDYFRDSFASEKNQFKKVEVRFARAILDVMNEAEYNYSLLNKESYESFFSDKLKLIYIYFCQKTLPGKNVTTFTIQELLKLWPPCNIRRTLRSREKELGDLLKNFAENKITDLAVQLIYEEGEIAKIKVRKKNLKPI